MAERVLSSHPLADVVVDLRTDQTTTLPRKFSGRRKARSLTVEVAGTHRTYRMEEPTQVLRWEDATGFSCAVVATANGFNLTSVLPHVAHLVFEHASNSYRNTRDPQEQGERLFAANLDHIRETVTSPVFAEPVPGFEGDFQEVHSLGLRLGFAAIGHPDLDDVPLAMRSSTGLAVVAKFQRAGFTSLPVILSWVEGLYGNVADANARLFNPTELSDLGAWGSAASWETALEWIPASKYNPPSARRLSAEACLSAKDAGFVPAMVATYLHPALADLKEPQANRFFQQWVAVAAASNAEQACRYLAAGISPREAKRMERTWRCPDAETLRFMAAMRDAQDRPPFPD